MGDTNDLTEFLSASLGATLDEIYQRLIDCDFAQKDPGLAMFVIALLNALGREGRGNRPTEVVLILAFGESGTAERGLNQLMNWRRGEMSGHDSARESGLGEQRDHRLCEMPLPVQPVQPLIGAKRLRDGPGPSHSVDYPTAALSLKRERMNEIEIQTSETTETLEKKEKDQSELCAKLQEYRAIARERDEWKKKFKDLQMAFKGEEIKHLKELYMARVSQVSPEVLATMNSSQASRDTRPRTKAQELCAPREPEAPQQTSQPAPNHLVVGDSLVRDLNLIFVSGQTTVLSFGGASVAQVIKMMELQGEDYLDPLVIMLGTNDVSRVPLTPEGK